MKTKIFTLVLALATSVGTIFAQSGTDGKVKWSVSGNVLTISRADSWAGIVDMYDYPSNDAPWKSYASTVTTIQINANIHNVGSNAFPGFTSVTDVLFGADIKKIGDNAFRNCSKLKSITLPAALTEVGSKSFAGCEITSLGSKNPTPPTIYDGSFDYNVNLRLLVPQGSVSKYKSANGWKKFEANTRPFNPGKCGTNATWEVKNNVVTISGTGAMDDDFAYPDLSPWYYWKPTSAIVGEGITVIGQVAFSACETLTTVELPSTLKKISADGFNGCTGLTSITCKATTPPDASEGFVFKDVPKTIPVYVPKGCVAKYKAAAGWKDFTNIQPIGGSQGKKVYATIDGTGTMLVIDYTDDPSSTAVDYWPVGLYPNVTKVVFNASMQEARPASTAEWFDNYTKLTTIEHLESLNTSEVKDMSRMFENCVALKSLNLSTFDTKSVTTMEAMFYGCDVLAELNVSGWNTANVTNMNSMFSWCPLLKVLDLTSFDTKKVTNMSFMFADCKALTTIKCNDDWSKNTALQFSGDMFKNCENIVGGNGTQLDKNNVDVTYARPDIKGQLGYFTGNGTSGLESVNHSAARSQKLIKDGQLYLLRDGKTFTVTGQEVK